MSAGQKIVDSLTEEKPRIVGEVLRDYGVDAGLYNIIFAAYVKGVKRGIDEAAKIARNYRKDNNGLG